MTSEDLFSQFPIPDWDMCQMEPVSGMQMNVVDTNNQQADNSQGTFQAPSFVDQKFGNRLLNPIRSLNNGGGYADLSESGLSSSSNWVPVQPSNQGTVMANKTTGQRTLLPVKRKAEVGNVSDVPLSQLPNKHPSQVGSLVESLNAKKWGRNDSSLGKSGLLRGQPVKKQTTQVGSASKNPRDSSEAVRSKMRESLASALSLALPKTDNVSNNEEKYPGMGDSKTSESNLPTGGQVSCSESADMLQNQELIASSADKSKSLPSQIPAKEIRGMEEQPFRDFHYLADVDASFGDNLFAKDDLLQGNGLSWAFDFDMQMKEGKDAQNSGELLDSQPMNEEADGQTNKPVETLNPEDLAFEIEAELFKLHGGVNKKYKEKGRSLLFNLKDPNNPELRERVISAEISPERLCSMSAEELASKELSEWRMAKAEEMAQMVVLPDTEVDMRRLVKKTHKGEYQVEFDHDEGIVADVSAGNSMVTQLVRKRKDDAPSSPKESDAVTENVSEENSSENKDASLIIPADGTDIMQGMTVDEVKDSELLPPIVSLDEFMESLNAEPPFEDVSADADRMTSSTKEEKSNVKSQSTDRSLGSPKDASSKKVLKKQTADMATKLSRTHMKHQVPVATGSKVDYIWDGNLQLNGSSSVSVRGLFLSGEKTSTKEWPVTLETKGRVRLDAFEKFLRELHMSRTRAVMVLQFVLKDKSSEHQRSNLSEAIDSYSSDDRLGYAEPASGVELYLCPPTPRIIEILNKNIAKERLDIENSAESGLIGAIVWRRAHVSNKLISPNSSSHHKKRQQQLPSSPQQRIVKNSSRVNIPTTHKSTPSTHVSPRPRPAPEEEEEEDEDDVPPGFGPQPPKEDDDLPEFSFSRTIVNPSLSSGPPQNLHLGSAKMAEHSRDHVRELIQKYGKSSTPSSMAWADNRGGLGIGGDGIEPWKDDEDDIPEWRPQQAQPHNGPPPPTVGLTAGQYAAQTVAQQLPSGLVQAQPGGGQWVQMPPHGASWRQQ